MRQAAIGLIALTWFLSHTAYAQTNEVREISWEQISERVHNRTVFLVQRAGGVLTGRIISVEADALTFKNKGSNGASLRLPRHDIKEIRIAEKAGKGSLQVLGTVLGLVGGFAVGACSNPVRWPGI